MTYFKPQRYLLVIILTFITLPFLETIFRVIDKTELGGYFKESPEPELSIESWFSDKYQLEKEKKINESFGFRNVCIKINNQVAYSVFGKANINDVIIGKDNYIYEGRYIKSYYGKDFIGESTMRQRMNQIKFISDTLTKLNKTLLIVFTPDKASYYPEYIPDDWKSEHTRTNYQAYFEYCRKMGIAHINFYDYFNQSKATNRYEYPLFPQYGLHWSTYGATIAADSIVKYIERERKIDMPDMVWNDKDINLEEAKEMDYDLANGMNLLFRLSSFKMAYPKVSYHSDPTKVKPSTLIVGDSFYWPMYYMGLSNVFKDAQFWYYNEQINPGNANTATVDFKKEIDRREVIIIIASEETSVNLGWGFIENLYRLYTTNNGWSAERFQREVMDYKKLIRSDHAWMKGIEERATKENVGIDSMITRDAIWEVRRKMKDEQEAEKNKNGKWGKEDIEIAVDKYRDYIKSDKGWMKGIEERSLRDHISVDSLITLDAIWEVNKMVKENK